MSRGNWDFFPCTKAVRSREIRSGAPVGGASVMDHIVISDLHARCVIGVSDEERREEQDVVVNLTLGADLRKAGCSDSFEDAVDYRAIKKHILRLVEGSSFHLLEALAESIAKTCLEYQGVEEVRVRIDKPSALRFARSVAVEIRRERPQ